jgi:hypothetical protein
MQLEVVRMVADALKSSAYGVNKKLLTVPRDLTDPMPPPVALIADEVRDLVAANFVTPPQTPAIYVSVDEMFEADDTIQTVAHRDSSLMIVILRYFHGEVDTPKAVRDAMYTMRAAAQAISAWMVDTTITREENGVQILGMPEIQYGLHRDAVGNTLTTAALGLRLQVRDNFILAPIVSLDPRVILTEAAVTFNVPATNGQYATERLNLYAPAGYACHRVRWTRIETLPAGSKIEEWGLKPGGDPSNDADYVLLFPTLMGSLAFTSRNGPQLRSQLRVVSGGTPGVVTVHGLAARAEPVLSQRSVTFNVPASGYAAERLTLPSGNGRVIGHISIYNQSPKVTGSVIEHWVLKPGGNLDVDADYMLGETFLSSSTARFASPTPGLRTFQMRIRGGGTAGQLVSHGIATAKTGLFEPPHAITV